MPRPEGKGLCDSGGRRLFSRVAPSSLGPVACDIGLVRVRGVRRDDGPAWSRMRLDDEHLLRPWEPTAAMSWEKRHQSRQWSRLYRHLIAEARQETLAPLAITLNGRFVGQITVGTIVRGPLNSAWVGYWVHSSVTGHRIATKALDLVVDHAFDRRGLGLHRLEATVQPDNIASRKVLAATGFREEGLLKRNLNVNGRWRDHVLMALTTEERH